MENATESQVCDDASRTNYANRLLSRAIHERRKPDTVTGRLFGMFAKNEKTIAQVEDGSKVLAGAGKR
ncbi:MAG TPA: hypothetical protein EYN91_05730 [Candidatus Melainabacteria bacterium]|jgi:hypothetical protein|nr:hypothetical protein [Candidatus Melainabacteria bacterium]HIN65590.1 hypothetical protein [Candidatus Obscuribacterales bacterium]